MRVKVIDRSRSYPASASNEISVLSWNLLAPSFDRTAPDGSVLHWSTSRLPQFERWFHQFADCDVLCFQEVDVTKSLADVREILSGLGFACVLQERHGFLMVNATFYKTRRLSLQWAEHRSRALVVGLALNDGREIAVANLHLEAGGDSRNEKQRVSQLSSVLKRVGRTSIVCGDFNSRLEPDSNLHSQLESHDLIRCPTKGITYSCHGYSDVLDHIFASSTLAAVHVLGSSQADLRDVEMTGIPNQIHPSDHLPVAATLCLKRVGIGREPSIPDVQCPSKPSKEVRDEWLKICFLANPRAGKQANKEQRDLEAAFLEIVTDEEARELCKWRDAARQAAKQILPFVVNSAVTRLRAAVQTKTDKQGVKQNLFAQKAIEHPPIGLAGA